jgi:hypothetical protein
MKKPKQVNPAEAHHAAIAQWRAAQHVLTLLGEARECAKLADNKRTLARIRLAISSAKGAVRICSGRVSRAQRAHVAWATGGRK